MHWPLSAGWLLRKINDLTGQLTALQSVVHEALVAAAQREVNNYYRLIAILEAQAQQQQSSGGGGTIGAAAAPGDASYLTLRRLKVWLSEPLGRLRVVASALEATKAQAGGQVINTLHAMSKHGDPLVRKVVAPLLEEVCVPYFKQITQWVLDGSLDASRADFLVAKQATGADLSAVWRKSFGINSSMQPSFISKELAQQILTAGKTINFLRERCNDSEWVTMVGATAHSLGASSGTYQQLRWGRLGVPVFLYVGLYASLYGVFLMFCFREGPHSTGTLQSACQGSPVGTQHKKHRERTQLCQCPPLTAH